MNKMKHCLVHVFFIFITNILISDAFTASSVRRPSFWGSSTIPSKSSSSISNQRSRPSIIILFSTSKVGVFYGTSTGNTESVAYTIVDELGSDAMDAQGPFVVDDILGSVATKFQEYDVLIVGTPTWNTGADKERSGTSWDEIYYGEMQDLKLNGKKVAVFGLGDQVSYKENYADATGELHDVFQGLGAQMYGYTSQVGYKHKASKSIRGDKFCGLLCDNVNQEDLTPERVKNWIYQLKSEGFFEKGTETKSAAVDVVATKVSAPSDFMNESTAAKELQTLDKQSEIFQSTVSSESKVTADSPQQQSLTFTPYLNSKTGVTMWVSTDRRLCFYTSGKP